MLDYHLYNVWMRFWTLNWVWPIRRNRQIYQKSVHPFYYMTLWQLWKVITIFLGTSAKLTPLSHWILELVVESLEISQMLFPSPLEIPQECLRGCWQRWNEGYLGALSPLSVLQPEKACLFFSRKKRVHLKKSLRAPNILTSSFYWQGNWCFPSFYWQGNWAGKCLAKGHIANTFQSWNLNLALLIPIICFFHSISLAYNSVKVSLHFTGHKL